MHRANLAAQHLAPLSVELVFPGMLALGMLLFAPPGASSQDTQSVSCSDTSSASIEIIISCANNGDTEAQFNLGFRYDTGEGVPRDVAEAVRWYRLAAEQGHALAQSNLGNIYARGEGVPQDDAEAVRWWRLAAEQGLAFAQGNLGVAYAKGVGVPEDDAEAVRWYRLAAEQGLALAQSNLGGTYAKGVGVPEDLVLAYMWYNLAAAQGDDQAQENKEIIVELMTREQIDEAQKLSREWLEQHR